MSIQQTKKQSDLEKRLKLLRQQVYGKGSEHSENSVSQSNQHARKSDYPTFRLSDSSGTPSSSEFSGNQSFRSDITYLHQDLTKIFLMAGGALGTQIILFILSKNHLLNLNFF